MLWGVCMYACMHACMYDRHTDRQLHLTIAVSEFFHKIEPRNMFDPHGCPCSFHLFITPGQKLEFVDNSRGSRKMSSFSPKPQMCHFFISLLFLFDRISFLFLKTTFQQLLCVFFLRCWGSVELLNECEAPFN